MPDAAEIERLRAEFQAALAAAATDQALREVRDRFLARKGGVVAALMKAVTGAPPADRPAARQARQPVQERDRSRRSTSGARRSRPAAPSPARVDITLPGRQAPLGHLHPLTLVRQQVEAIFSRMGYEILEGPEIEDDYHNFEALNMPPEHPARDMQDTFFLGRAVPQHGLGTPGTRVSTRPAPRRPARDAAAHAHLGDADPLHGGPRAAGPHRRHRQGVPARQPGPHAHADVPPVRGAAGGRAA